MKATEIKPLNHQVKSEKEDPDRLGQLLLWTAIFLLAAVIAICVDLWLWPSSDGTMAQAFEPTSAVPALLTSPPATSVPTWTPMPISSPATEPATPTSAPPTAMPTVVTETPTVVAEAPTVAFEEPPTQISSVPSSTVTPEACVPPDDWGIIMVQQGNTLRSIARRYGTDVETMMYVNCLNTHTIFLNQRLYVPGPLASPTLPLAELPEPLPDSNPRPGASSTPIAQAFSQATPVPTSAPNSRLDVDIPDYYLNILLLGSDKRPHSGAWRTDSMIIVSVDRQNNVVRLLSIPRDLWVNIPGHGYNRINTADLWGELARKGTGPERVKQTIYQNLGIPIHYYVRIDFQGFIKIVDAVGGVDIDVDCPLPDINLTAGMHHMSGRPALRYARSRKSTNDFDRGRRQRKVLMALWDQALDMDIIPKLPELWQSMGGTFQTDLPLSEVINLAYMGVQLKPQQIMSRAIGGGHVQGWITPQGASVLLPQQDKIRNMLNSFYAPVKADQLDEVGTVRVSVFNGSQAKQSAQLAAAKLKWDGFKVVGTSPADRQNYAQSQILVLTGNMEAAQQVAKGLKLPAAAIQDHTISGEQPDPANPVDIHVVVGRDYNPCQR